MIQAAHDGVGAKSWEKKARRNLGKAYVREWMQKTEKEDMEDSLKNIY